MILVALTPSQAEDLALLKRNMLEESHPFFSDEQLAHLLETWGWDVPAASYHGLVAKAENDSITLPSGLQMPNNQDYWLKLARSFRKGAGGAQKRGDQPCR